jgi:hypothetical protein
MGFHSPVDRWVEELKRLMGIGQAENSAAKRQPAAIKAQHHNISKQQATTAATSVISSVNLALL